MDARTVAAPALAVFATLSVAALRIVARRRDETQVPSRAPRRPVATTGAGGTAQPTTPAPDSDASRAAERPDGDQRPQGSWAPLLPDDTDPADDAARAATTQEARYRRHWVDGRPPPLEESPGARDARERAAQEDLERRFDTRRARRERARRDADDRCS